MDSVINVIRRSSYPHQDIGAVLFAQDAQDILAYASAHMDQATLERLTSIAGGPADRPAPFTGPQMRSLQTAILRADS